jgi:hypothetical protein
MSCHLYKCLKEELIGACDPPKPTDEVWSVGDDLQNRTHGWRCQAPPLRTVINVDAVRIRAIKEMFEANGESS